MAFDFISKAIFCVRGNKNCRNLINQTPAIEIKRVET
jgi:hypothetical protein